MAAVHATDHVEDALRTLDAGHRTVADGQWGLRVEAAGWPLDVGLSLQAGATLLRVQAEVCEPGLADPHDLLHRNRRTPLVAFTETRAGTVWAEAWLPVAAVDATLLDRVLGVLVDAAQDVRAAAYAASRSARSR